MYLRIHIVDFNSKALICDAGMALLDFQQLATGTSSPFLGMEYFIPLKRFQFKQNIYISDVSRVHRCCEDQDIAKSKHIFTGRQMIGLPIAGSWRDGTVHVVPKSFTHRVWSSESVLKLKTEANVETCGRMWRSENNHVFRHSNDSQTQPVLFELACGSGDK